VLDFTRALAGPHCTRMLSDMGADVVKIEPPTGDLTRSFPPRVGHLSMYFLSQNCGKRNISIDLSQPEGVELAALLAEKVDVVVENFSPPVMDRIGLGYEALAARNPRLVYGSISGYGPGNSWSHRKAYAPVIHAEAGLTHLHARRFGETNPVEATSHADVYTSLECLSGILAALHHRHTTGRGQHVVVSMAATLLCVSDRTCLELTDEPEKYDQDRTVLVHLANGRQVVICGEPTNETIFRDYCRLLDRSDVRDDPRFAAMSDRIRHRGELVQIIQEWVLGFDSADDLERALETIKLPIGVVRSVKEVEESTWAKEWGAFVDIPDRHGGHGVVPQSPWRFSDATSGAHGSFSYPGEDNAAVLQEWLDFDVTAIADLADRGVLRSRIPADVDEPPA
jgi:crotonobetainyl-CoA:carnitine CoA-transferase CaiB-like acyl-CoA transferase